MNNGKITWSVFGWCIGRKLCTCEKKKQKTCIAEINDG